jgi:DNA polymerase III epsilon subunit-like protein
MTSICLYDIESSGLDIMTDSILEICFIDYLSKTTILHIYINPSNCKKIENSHIHKIDENVLKDKNALNIKDALININKSLSEFYSDKTILLTAHNNFGFDQLILESEFKRNNVILLENILFFDTLPFIKKYFKNAKSYKLQNIYAYLISSNSDNNSKFHTAEYDTLCLYEVLNKIFTILIKEQNLDVNLDEYIRISFFNKKILKESFSKINNSGFYPFLNKKIKYINDLITIYKLCSNNDELFLQYFKNTFKISSKFSLDEILKQIKLINEIHNK